MLPDKSVLIGQKLVKNAKIQKFQCDILSNFQTMAHLTLLYFFIYTGSNLPIPRSERSVLVAMREMASPPRLKTPRLR